MTEAEWRASRDGVELARLLWNRTHRKRRLVAVAFARRVLYLASNIGCELALDAAERYADNLMGQEELRCYERQAQLACSEFDDPLAAPQLCRRAARLAAVIAASGTHDPEQAAWRAAEAAVTEGQSFSVEERVVQAELVRDILGHSFVLPFLDPHWRTSDVLGLARGIYEERAFERMPILADALMDAGCDDEDILAHCRSTGEHVRGCWVVDLVLGKE